MSKNKVEVFLPKFRLEMASLLNDKLQGLGMEDAFDESRADFSGMTPARPGLYISKVVHKAFVDVNEEGTEAAAATAVIMAIKSVMSANPVFRADRPFLFMIREVASGSILFLGRCADPR